MGFLNTLPGAVVQGLIWGILAIGVYITYKILDIADLTVDGSMVTGACVCAVLVVAGGSGYCWRGNSGCGRLATRCEVQQCNGLQ